jgi:hypothetical protein
MSRVAATSRHPNHTIRGGALMPSGRWRYAVSVHT